MAPTSINDLPVELHTSILKYLFSLSRQPCARYLSILLPIPAESEWVEKDTRSTSLFPFNVISVSKLWRDIMILIPECWTRVVFDVAKDPTPLLAAFVWSGKMENIEVFVFNSENTQMVDEARESSFVSAISAALYPHIHRCKSIVFDVTYPASLPAPTMFFVHDAPYLSKLSLNCHIKDLGSLCSQNIPGPPRDFVTSFPKLGELSLTGFWFMNLILHARKSDWLYQLSIQCCISLSISNFTFPKRGRYSLRKFVSHISGTEFSEIQFRDLSLAYTYDGPKMEPEFVYEIGSNFRFHSVSKDFLAHLYAIADVSSDESLSFEACEIPELNARQYVDSLKLTNIIDDDEGASLRHILQVWRGSRLAIYSCPSFNDSLLSWLMPEKQGALRSKVSSLWIVDCENFSSHALKELICLHNEVVLKNHHGETDIFGGDTIINELYVTGRGPCLSDEDKRWFSQNNENTRVHWVAFNDTPRKHEIFHVRRQSNDLTDTM